MDGLGVIRVNFEVKQMLKHINLIAGEAIKLIFIPISYYLDYPVIKPATAGLFLTDLCNSRCSMCNFWKNSLSNDTNINYTQGKLILKQLKDFGIKFLSFSAEGEIFMNPDAIKILDYAKSQNFVISLNTNALSINKSIAGSIARLNPYSLIIGLDTVEPVTYMKIRGIEDGLDKVVASIRNLQECNFKNITLGVVIQDSNVNELLKILEFANKHKIKTVRFTPYQFFGFGKKIDADEFDKYSSPDFQKKLRKTIKDLINTKKRFPAFINNSVSFLNLIPEFFKSKQFMPIKCIKGYNSIIIYPDGDVILCQIMGNKAKIGNIYETSIDKIWVSNDAKKVRKLIMDKKCPGCWLSCYAEDNLLYTFKYGLEANLNRFLRFLNLYTRFYSTKNFAEK